MQTLFNFKDKDYPFSIKNKIQGKLYSKPEDFVVIELDGSDDNTGSEYIEYTLDKKNISTFDAVTDIAKRLNIDSKLIKYSGLKDTYAITSQKITLPKQHMIDCIKAKNYTIKDPKYVKSERRIGGLWGNSFQIAVRDIKNISEAKDVMVNFKRMISTSIPNYYGHQRFGVRQNGHRIGLELLKRNYERATKIFLTETGNENRSVTDARLKILKHWGDWRKCQKFICKHDTMVNELIVIRHLIEKPQDFANAMRLNPLCSIFIQSYSSYVYNIVLKEVVKKDFKIKQIPLLGYKIKKFHPLISDMYRKILIEDKITSDMYYNEKYPEFSYEGREKDAFYIVEKPDYIIQKNTMILKFSLPKGTYANLFLELFISNTNHKKKLN
jgi:tRNA pseudouridine13 synthase